VQPRGDELEWKTRRSRIDPKLRDPGWTIVPFTSDLDPSAHSAHAVTEFPTESGPADYALVPGGRIVGIIEAKKLSLGPQNVLTEAERYAQSLPPGDFNFRGLRAPFLNRTILDDLGFIRTTALCRKYNVETRRFVALDGPDYEHAD
jgi:type I site-specific restriction endonuclease